MVEKRRPDVHPVNEPAAKRARMPGPGLASGRESGFALRRLPLELQDIVYSVAPFASQDIMTGLRTLMKLELVDRQSRSQVEGEYRRNPALGSLRDTARHVIAQFDSTTAGMTVSENHKRICLLPILSEEQRKIEIGDLLKDAFEPKGIPLRMGEILVENVRYASPYSKAIILGYVMIMRDSDSYIGDPFAKAVENIEYFEPDQRKQLVAEVFKMKDPHQRGRRFEALLPNVDLLDESDQVRLFSAIFKGDFNVGLAPNCAKVFDRICIDGRKIVADGIEKKTEDQNRWLAIGELSRHFDCLDECMQSRVASTISLRLSPPPGTKTFIRQGWVASELEAAHWLSHHSSRLAPDDLERVEGFIRKMVDAPEGQNLRAKAHLITHLGKYERSRFVTETFRNAPSAVAGDMILGLTGRMQYLSADEREIYKTHICNHRTETNCYRGIRESIQQNLDLFESEARGELVAAGFETARTGNFYGTISYMSELIPKAHLLGSDVIRKIAEEPEKIASGFQARPNVPGYAEAHMAHVSRAARCFANWGRGQTLELARAHDRVEIPGDGPNKSTADEAPSRTYDERLRDGRLSLG